MLQKRWLVGLAAVGVVAAGTAITGGDDYEVSLVVPSAAQISNRSPVWINGHHAGKVTDLAVKNGKAVVTLAIDDDFAPIHDGTTSRVEWVSAVGERVLTLYPGKPGSVELPDGALIESTSHQVEVDQVLQALDEPTRKRLTSLLAELNDTIGGHEADVRATIQGASGTVRALGEVLNAVDQDGPAIRSLVTQLSDLTGVAASRRERIASSVADLESLSTAVAGEQEQLSRTLEQLPDTLHTARTTLGKVPGASDATVGLLRDLQPATARLPKVSKNLAPVLVDLRPTVAELRPLLSAADQLLRQTPGLLDSSHGVLPSLDTFLTSMGPALAFLRPYTPEAIGGLANWGQAFAPYDGAGHTWAGLLGPGTNALNESLVPLPTSRLNPAPPPGQPVGQPWTDANGSEIR
ncbi:MlaD family protein [Nocardioides cavernaquae]|uniref:MlaD family protein n=1 Tax=Nocardioides cavernaquae TaxID=2321396 RepID=UPI001EE533B5|nr:MlaD family protein [Nocardioides cavernaquae]